MNSTLEKKVDRLTKLVEQIKDYDRYLPIEKFCEKEGYTRRQADYLREQYPHIWQGIGGDKVDRKDRTVWRKIRIDMQAYNALFTSPLKKQDRPA